MTTLATLWLPILLSAVFVFIASSIIHMASPWHKSDFPRLENQDQVMAALRPLAIPPGDYLIPRPSSRAELRSPEFMEKARQGPVVLMTVMPSAQPSMGRNLAMWFVYCLVVSLFAAYIAGRALAPAAASLEIVRFAGAAAFLGYAVALWQLSIWYRRSWGITIRATVDGLIYAVLTGFTLAWLWPR
jgi:hypothetical protein